MKTTHYLMSHPKKLVQIIADSFDCPGTASTTINTMAQYCSYDKRKKRSNYQQDLEMVFL